MNCHIPHRRYYLHRPVPNTLLFFALGVLGLNCELEIFVVKAFQLVPAELIYWLVFVVGGVFGDSVEADAEQVFHFGLQEIRSFSVGFIGDR